MVVKLLVLVDPLEYWKPSTVASTTVKVHPAGPHTVSSRRDSVIGLECR